MRAIFITLLVFSGTCFLSLKAQNSESNQKDISTSNNYFAENKGQLSDNKGNSLSNILYYAQFSAYQTYFSKNSFSYVLSDYWKIMGELRKESADANKNDPKRKIIASKGLSEKIKGRKINICRIDMEFSGANPSCEINPSEETRGAENYYYGNCPDGIIGVHSFQKISYKNLYPGIDMDIFHDASGQLKYNLLVAPGSSPSEIKMLYKGANDVFIRDGKLVIKNNVGDIVESLPEIFQMTASGKQLISGAYKVTKTENGFLVELNISQYDHSLSLIIDPVIWITYYGGDGDNESTGVTADAAGNSYVCGFSGSQIFPVTVGAFQTSPGDLIAAYDAVLIKFNANGTRQWATYYGGIAMDIAQSVTCDQGGNPIMTGSTSSSDFPISVGCFQNAIAGGTDAFIVKFNPNGTRNFGTFYGGSDDDSGNGVTTDSQDNIIVTGVAGNNFPITPGAYQPALAGMGITSFFYPTWGMGLGDAFVLKLTPTGNQTWCTYYGGADEDWGMSVKTDSQDNIAICGGTNSANFPVSPGCFQAVSGGGTFVIFGIEAFIVKFNSAGNRLWGTYIGGGDEDVAESLAIDTQDNVIVTGVTASLNFPVSPGCDQPVYGGSYDVFIFKASANGSRAWATYHGTTILFEIFAQCTIDNSDNVYLYYEWEDSFDTLAVLGCAFQKSYGGIEDQYIIKYNSSGSQVCSTYLGGPSEEDWDNSPGEIFWKGGYMYFCTNTEGPGFPVTAGAYQPTMNPTAIYNMAFGRLCSASCGDTSATHADFTIDNANCGLQFYPSVAACDTSVIQYQWNFPGGNPASSSIKFPAVNYTASGTYTVQLILSSPCGADTINKPVTVAGIDCNSSIVAPNVFTPNGDGVNDQFVLTYVGITGIKIEIYDRWGAKISEISDVNNFWDGKNRAGKMCSDGVYYYVVNATGIDNKNYNLTGFVQLISGKE
jgi:gliding motility-associated-like protein